MIISKRNLYKLLYVLIFTPLLIRFFTDNFGMPYVIMPIFDIISILLLMFAYSLVCKRNKKLQILELWLIIFIIAGTISIIANGGTSFSNLFYSIRPYFRMIIAMLISTITFSLKSFEKMYKYIESLLYINAAVMTYQYIFQGLRQDIIGGILGNNQGVNSIQNIFFIFVFCVTVEFYLRKLISKRKLIINAFLVLYITALAEINLIIFEVAIIGMLLFFLNNSTIEKISIRRLFLISVGFIAILGGLYLFMKLNPERPFLLSFKNILEYLGFNSGSTGVYRISRMKVFSQLGNSFFKDNILGWLFGYGLGNCSTHSAFYNQYQYLQYTFFSSSSVFLEVGLFGVFANLGVLVNGLVLSIKRRKSTKDNKCKAWMDISIAMTIIMIIMFFYNTTLRDTYTAFFAGTILSLPYITTNTRKNFNSIRCE